MRLLIAATLAAILPLSANSESRTTSDGVTYQVEYNRHGAILTGNGETIYLGRSCDAWLGDQAGYWDWANGGFGITFPNRVLVFGRNAPHSRRSLGNPRRCLPDMTFRIDRAKIRENGIMIPSLLKIAIFGCYDRLHAKGLIHDPANRAKSVAS